MGPWAVFPINGMLFSSIGSLKLLPVLVATTKFSASLQITALSSSTPSFNFKTVVARPERSLNSSAAIRLKRPSLLNKPIEKGILSAGITKTSTIFSAWPSTLSGRNFSIGPGCWAANSQRNAATLPPLVKASRVGAGCTARINWPWGPCSP